VIGRFLAGFWRWLRPLKEEAIDGEAPLGRYFDHHAAFVTQRSVAGYVQMKTRVHLHELLKETMFREAYDRCRWTSYAAVLGDLGIITEGYVRPHLTGGMAEAAMRGLAEVHRRVLDGAKVPPELGVSGLLAQSAFEARLARARMAPPQSAGDVARVGAKVLFETLPIHADLRALDERSFVDGVRFVVVSATEPLRRLLKAEALAADLARLGATGPAAGGPSPGGTGPAISAGR